MNVLFFQVMPLFHTRDKTENSSGIVFKDIIVTFTVVPALRQQQQQQHLLFKHGGF